MKKLIFHLCKHLKDGQQLNVIKGDGVQLFNCIVERNDRDAKQLHIEDLTEQSGTKIFCYTKVKELDINVESMLENLKKMNPETK